MAEVTAFEILFKLREWFGIELPEITELERSHKGLYGLALEAELQRRIEREIFELAYARYVGYESNHPTALPGGEYVGVLIEIPHHDHVCYERRRFTDCIRTMRRGMGILPDYVVQAYHELLRENEEKHRIYPFAVAAE